MLGNLFVPLGWALVHFVWQGAVLAASLRGFTAVAGAARARTRYAAACATLAIMLGAFAATAWRHAGESDGRGRSAMASASSRSRSAATIPGRVGDPRTRGGAEVTPSLRPTVVQPSAMAAATAAAGDVVSRALPVLVPAWALGVAVLSARLAGGWALARRLVTRDVTRPPTACERQLRRLCGELGVRAPVRALVSARVAVPAVLGWLQPVILLPLSAVLSVPPAQLEFLLRHELAHVLRRDYVANLVQRAAEVVLFYHPAVWWVSGEIRAAREQCCDEIALGAADVGDYVRALAAMEATRGRGPRPVVALGADGASLLGRARYLLRRAAEHDAAGPHGRHADRAGGVAALLLLAAATVVLAGGARPLPRAAATARSGDAGRPAAAACAPGATRDSLTLCPALEARAAAALAATGRHGAVVVQEVASGAMVAYVATSPSASPTPHRAHAVTAREVDLGLEASLPASLWKLLTATLWWEHDLPDGAIPCPAALHAGTRRVTTAAPLPPAAVHSVEDVLAHSCNTAAVVMTLRLREVLGPERLLADYGRLGFPARPPFGGSAASRTTERDSTFWASSSLVWRARMSPAASGARLAPGASDDAWAALALGVAHARATPLHISRFLQAVGAGGVMRTPTVETARATRADTGRRIMRAATAARLQRALRAGVDRGTASGVRPLLAGSRWHVGGKTGTTGRGPGGQSDGWFAGLVFDEHDVARYTVVVYVRGGGAGGGTPARLAASLTRALAGDVSVAAFVPGK